MDYDEQVEAIRCIMRGWIQNLARNAVGEGYILEPEVVSDALSSLAIEYDGLIEEPDFDGFLQSLNGGEEEDEGNV